MRRCGSSPRGRTWPVGWQRTSRATALPSRPATRCCCCSARPIATPADTPTRTSSTFIVTTSRTSLSAKVCTTAWEPTSPGWRAASRWTRSSTAGPSGISTTTQHNSRRRLPCAGGRSCGSCCPSPATRSHESHNLGVWACARLIATTVARRANLSLRGGQKGTSGLRGMPVTGGYTLAGLGGASLSRFRLWHLEFVEESVHQSDGLVVAAGGAEPLFEYQRAPDGGDDDRQGSGWEFLGVEVVLADDEVQCGDLLFAPAFGPGRDLRSDLLAVVCETHELQQQPGI